MPRSQKARRGSGEGSSSARPCAATLPEPPATEVVEIDMRLRSATSRFFVLSFGFTWCFQLPGALAHLGWLPGEPAAYLPAAMLGIFGPFVAATYLTFQERGAAGVQALYAGLRAWRVSPKWYVFALFLPGLALSAVLWAIRAAGQPGDWHYLPGIAECVSALVVSVAEETGWRGYALPRLAARYGAFLGSCILGALWAVWHVPMFLALDVPMSLGPVLLLFFVGGSLWFTYLVRKTSGSLLIAVLAHLGAHLNNSHAALPGDTLPLIVHTVVYAGLGLAAMRGAAFERAGPVRAHSARP